MSITTNYYLYLQEARVDSSSMNCDQTYLAYGVLKCAFNALKIIDLQVSEITVTTKTLVINENQPIYPSYQYVNTVWPNLHRLSIEDRQYTCNDGLCVTSNTTNNLLDHTTTPNPVTSSINTSTRSRQSVTDSNVGSPEVNNAITFILCAVLFICAIALIAYVLYKSHQHRRYRVRRLPSSMEQFSIAEGGDTGLDETNTTVTTDVQHDDELLEEIDSELSTSTTHVKDISSISPIQHVTPSEGTASMSLGSSYFRHSTLSSPLTGSPTESLETSSLL